MAVCPSIPDLLFLRITTRDLEQPPLWIAASDLPVSPGHPFYTRLNALLDADGFDAFVANGLSILLRAGSRGDGPSEWWGLRRPYAASGTFWYRKLLRDYDGVGRPVGQPLQ